jgi:hypothetical protein
VTNALQVKRRGAEPTVALFWNQHSFEASPPILAPQVATIDLAVDDDVPPESSQIETHFLCSGLESSIGRGNAMGAKDPYRRVYACRISTEAPRRVHRIHEE